MRISDWSSDVCSSDLQSALTGWLWSEGAVSLLRHPSGVLTAASGGTGRSGPAQALRVATVRRTKVRALVIAAEPSGRRRCRHWPRLTCPAAAAHKGGRCDLLQSAR